jgi:hypothetical protein
MKTLLIWDTFGEDEAGLGFYLIEDAPDWLERCHQYYLNGDVPEDVYPLLVRVCDAICTDIAFCTNADDELATTWTKLRLKTDDVCEVGAPVRIVICGLIP